MIYVMNHTIRWICKVGQVLRLSPSLQSILLYISHFPGLPYFVSAPTKCQYMTEITFFTLTWLTWDPDNKGKSSTNQ